MYTRLVIFVMGLACLVVLATAFAQIRTDIELQRRQLETSQRR